MIGAIIGDIIGSIYERHNIKTKDFPLFGPRCRFTDDTVLTVAVAHAILDGVPYETKLREYYRLYPDAGFGGGFRQWARSDSAGPYRSHGNGSAMRVSPVGYTSGTLEETLDEAKRSAEVTHNHPEGIRGAQAVAAAIFMARQGASKSDIRSCAGDMFGYDMARTLDAIRPGYRFDVSCQGSVPEAIIAFLESSDFVDAVRNAISLGGDSDTIACIAGAIAEAFYREIPLPVQERALSVLDERLLGIVNRFRKAYMEGGGGEYSRL
ncbi:MAG: ADP-ribosylglycohydrolase family protein [Spirochaetes bacterium]|nr:ADP-ribosylglycohydrolase family protein [Spirochaetota bacterium]